MKKTLFIILMIFSALLIPTFGNNLKVNKKDDIDFSKLTISYLGDSITMDKNVNNYPTTLSEEMEFKLSFNYGISSSSIGYMPKCKCHSGATTHDPFVFRYNKIAESDIIMVNGGINDWKLNIPLGYNFDKTSTTFYGALNNLVSGLKYLYPNSYIVFVTGFKYKDVYVNDIGIDFKAYNNAIVEICEKNNIDYFDTYNEVEFDINKHTYDKIHPNDEFISNIWVPEIIKYLKENYKA